MDDLSPSPQEMTDRIWHYFAGPTEAVPETDLLEPLAERFIQLKQHLGQRYLVNGRCVRDFLRFLGGRGVHHAWEVSLDHMLAWDASRAHVQGTTWMREVSAVSVFLDHLKVLGKISTNLTCFLRRRPTSDFRPYIFTVDELRRIFTLQEAGGPGGDRGLVYFLLYACGLRVSEGIHLKLRNLDVEQGTIFIEKTKFNKDRLLPLHPRVLDRLRSYRDNRRAGAPPEAPLFLNARGRGYDVDHFSRHFHQDLTNLGLYQKTREADGLRYGSPRLHALRHSFAVHRLLRWYREGADVQKKLPLLSTYLGHSAVEYTQVYLKITALLLREAHERFVGRWEGEFPLEP
jgi:integrase/recombinase XerD